MGRVSCATTQQRNDGANSKISKQPGKSQHSLLLLQHEQIDTCLLLLLLLLLTPRTVYVVQYLLTKSQMNGDALLALSSVHPMSCRLDVIGYTKESLEIETLKSVGRIQRLRRYEIIYKAAGWSARRKTPASVVIL